MRLSFVHDGEELLFGHTHAVGHLAEDLTLLLDDLISLKVVNEFVVLSWHAKGLLERVDVSFLAPDDLLKTFTNHLVTLELENDELLILFKLFGQLLIELNVLF